MRNIDFGMYYCGKLRMSKRPQEKGKEELQERWSVAGFVLHHVEALHAILLQSLKSQVTCRFCPLHGQSLGLIWFAVESPRRHSSATVMCGFRNLNHVGY